MPSESSMSELCDQAAQAFTELADRLERLLGLPTNGGGTPQPVPLRLVYSSDKKVA